MRKIYISVPITGREKEAREHADLVKANLSRKGYCVVNPFEIHSGRNPTYEDCICYDLRAMLDCDAIYFCKGWKDSLGCNIEHAVAQCYIASGRKTFKLIYEISTHNDRT